MKSISERMAALAEATPHGKQIKIEVSSEELSWIVAGLPEVAKNLGNAGAAQWSDDLSNKAMACRELAARLAKLTR